MKYSDIDQPGLNEEKLVGKDVELTPEDVEFIRENVISGRKTPANLAKKFNIELGHVNFIARRGKRGC